MSANLSGSPQKSKSTEQNNAPPSSLALRSEEATASIPSIFDAYPSLAFSLQDPLQVELINKLLSRAGNYAASLSIFLTEIRPENREPQKALAGAYLDLCELGKMLESLGVSSVEPLPYTRRGTFGPAMNNLVFCFKSDYPYLNIVLHFPRAKAGLEQLIVQSESYEDMLKYFQVATAPEEMRTELYHQNKKLNKELRLLLIALRNIRAKHRIEELSRNTGKSKRAQNEEE